MEHAELLTTVGAATVIVGTMIIIWTELVRTSTSPVSSRVFTLFGGRVDADQFILIGLAIVMTVGLELWYRFTLRGRASLAVAENRRAAELRGINVRAKSYGAFILAGALAGIAAAFIGPETYVYPELGNSLVLVAFVAFVLGGSGSLLGGTIGGLIIGLVDALSARYIGTNYTNIIVLGVLLGTLIILPNGMFGGSVSGPSESAGLTSRARRLAVGDVRRFGPLPAVAADADPAGAAGVRPQPVLAAADHPDGLVRVRRVRGQPRASGTPASWRSARSGCSRPAPTSPAG